jgi:hypothetical protein
MRGAAMVEAAVSIPFFVVIFACILYAGRVYQAKLRVMRETKQSAWTYGMANCGTAGDPITTSPQASDATQTLDPGTPAPGLSTDPLHQIGATNGPGGDTATRSFGTSTAQKSAPVLGPSGLAFQTQVKNTESVMCNEPPHDGSVKGMGSAVWGYVSRW